MTRVLVVDDSPLMRRLLGDILRDAEGFEVAFARNGLEALDALRAAPPDVITLDVQMPEMDGLACLDRIMLERPTPVVMISALTADGAAETLEALSLGAVDVIAKPNGAVSLQMDTLGPQIVETLRNAAGARLRRAHRLTDRVRTLNRAVNRSDPLPATARLSRRDPATTAFAGECELPGVVLVGCSTGGPPALDALLAPLPATFALPIVVAQHMPRTFTGALARRLDGLCALSVREVDRPTRIESGTVYIARGDGDLIMSARPGGIHLVPAPESIERRWHPSVDRLVESALGALPPSRLIGVLMTGMGNDGAAAMSRLRETGGFTIAEAEETAVVWGMPGDLVRRGGASVVSPLDQLAGQLMAAVAG